MNKMKNLIKSKKGDGLLSYLGLILVIALISVPIYCFTESMIQIVHIKQTSQNAIDVFTSKTAREEVKSIKSGHDYTKTLNREQFKTDLQNQLTLRNRYKGYDTKGNFVYKIDNLQVNFISNQTLKTEVSYTIIYQYYFMSAPLIQSEIKVRQESRYNLKER